MNNQPGTQRAPKRLIAIMVFTVMVILVSTVWLLYEASFNQQLQRLVEIAKARAGLIEAIVNHDEYHQHSYDKDIGTSVLKLVKQAHTKFRGFGESGEFTLARLNDDNIEFLLGHRHNELEQPAPVSINSTLAEPMRRALQGKSGTLVGLDYRSVEVLAAHEPINMLGWGVVAKINMSEIRDPFIKAGIISILIATLIIALGSVLIIRIMSPLIAQLGDDHFYLRTLFQNSPIGLALCRMDGTLVETNTVYDTITGYSLKEANALSYWDITPDKYRDMEAEQLWHLEHQGGYGPYEKEYIHKEGHLVPVRLKGKIINRGGEEFIWSSVEDISDRVEAEKRLRQAATIFESTGEGIIITDESNKIILVNSAYCEITGYSEEEVLGRDPNILRSDKHEKGFYQRLWQQLESKGNWRGEMWNRRKDGSIFPVWQHISAIEDDHNVTNYVSVFSDISELKAVEEQLSHLAHHDELTGLHNRLYFKSQVEQSVQSAKRNQHMMALLFLDLDGFKQVNDSFGHDVGDQLLQVVAKRLKECVREEDTVARMGGDEFIIILNQIKDSKDASLVANNLLKMVTRPVELQDQTLMPSTSIGISIYPSDAESANGLQNAADNAMYGAKESGKNSYQYFSQLS